MRKAGLVRVEIVENFSGGADGRCRFRAGQTIELPEAEAALYVAKGHAEAVEDTPKPVAPTGAKKDATP